LYMHTEICVSCGHKETIKNSERMLAIIMLKLKLITCTEIKRFVFRFTFCLVFVSLVPADHAFCGNTSQSFKAPPQVLVIHSYYSTFTWSNNITQGIRKAFAVDRRSEALLHFEFLDAKRHPEKAYLDRMADLLRIKYPDPESIDVIICSDDQALNFLLDRPNTLFAGVPVVFCGVNGYNAQMRRRGRPLTGVIEAIDPKSTVEAALRLQPHIREVLVINDITRTGHAIENMARQMFKPFHGRLIFRYVGDMTMAELQAEVSALSRDAIVFLFVFNRDNKGRNFTHEFSLKCIADHSKVPIYGPWTFYLGKGIIGGMLTSGEKQGETAARLALRILNGEKAGDIPVVMKSPNHYMFDSRQLSLHNLPLDKIPSGSVIVNSPSNFYRKYFFHIWAGAIALVVQTAIIVLLLLNIKRRKDTEKKLISSEEKYRSLVETMTDAVFTLDTNGRFTFLNTEFENVTGYRSKDFIGHPFTDILVPEYIESTVDRFKRGLSGEAIPVYEVELKHKDGKIVPVELKVTSLLDDHEKNIGRIGVARDISERKHTEEVIRENERFLQNVFDGIQDGISVLTRDLSILKVNAWMEKMYSDHMPLVGKKCYEVYQQRKSSCPWCPSLPSIKTGEVHSAIVPYPSESDPKGWIDLSAFPLKDANGSVIGIIEHVKDITDRKNAEEALRESEAKFKSLGENAPDIIYNLALDGSFTYVNPAWKAILGYEPEEVLGKYFVDFTKQEEARGYVRIFKNIINNRETLKDVDITIVHKDGSTRLFSASGAPDIGKRGEVTGMVGLFKDITDHRRLEAQLQQAQKMEALGTLGGGIAHDFNNLLMGIQGRTSLMLMDKDSSNPDFEHLKGIEDYVKSAADLTKQLLGFARGGKYEVKPTDINEMIKKSSGMFGRTKKEIQIHRKYQKDVWAIEADRGQVEQVLMNLYVNAWHAMPGGGELYLLTENVSLDEDYVKPFGSKPGRYVKISVTDTGIGMDEDTLERIFDPFFTTKEMGRGTGLGLASAYGIIKNHGGFINVYSEKGEGSTFNIYLPASEKEIIREIELSEDMPKGSETVLLVDDEDMIIAVGKQLLQKLGYKVLTAENGKEATEIYKKNKGRIDIVILDMIMPDMSGGDTFDRLKEIKSGVKVLLSSGYSINGQASEILERGCGGFIQKPFNMKQLSRKLRDILDKETVK